MTIVDWVACISIGMVACTATAVATTVVLDLLFWNRRGRR